VGIGGGGRTAVGMNTRGAGDGGSSARVLDTRVTDLGRPVAGRPLPEGKKSEGQMPRPHTPAVRVLEAGGRRTCRCCLRDGGGHE
jgi:hypothetical protein